MKKILTTVAVVIAALQVTAQEGRPESAVSQERRNTISIGPAVGFGHSYIQNVGEKASFKPSWNVGITANLSSTEHIGWSLDVLYSQEGGMYNNVPNRIGGNDDVNITLQYLRVPVKFAYFFGDLDNRFRPKFTIGPSMGFLIGNDFKVNGANAQPADDDARFNTNYKNFDLGGQASVGFNYKIAEALWFNADAYYYQGFLDINNRNEYNSNFGLRIGLAVGL